MTTIAEKLMKEGYDAGIQKGKLEERREIVLKMKGSGFNAYQIEELTGIPLEEVIKLLNMKLN